MRFRHFIFAIAAIVAVKSEDLFTSPELSDDMLLPPLDISNDLDDSFLDNNNDLFVDSSDPNTLNSFELTASCPSNDGQHPARLRGRDEVCTPNSQPSLDGFINMLGTFGNPSQREKKLEDAASSAKVDEQDPCPAARPYHLCCEGFGRKLSAPPYGGIIRYLHRTMDNCEPVPIIPICVAPRKWEVCCEEVIYPSSPEQINNDLAMLSGGGNARAVDAYMQFLADFGHLTLPEGQQCITWGIVVKDEFDD